MFFSYRMIVVVTTVLVVLLDPGIARACDPGLLKFPLTDVTKTFIRKGAGEWAAPRQSGNPHTGVDIITNATQHDPEAYSVAAIAPGVVAYSDLNGSQSDGFGNVIIIDHGTNCYSFYAHLANKPFTPSTPGGNLLKKVGDKVNGGEKIGYFVDIKADVDSTGNAQRAQPPTAQNQVHFELIAAPSGRSGTGKIKDVILKADGKRVDPTPLLKTLGYKLQ